MNTKEGNYLVKYLEHQLARVVIPIVLQAGMLVYAEEGVLVKVSQVVSLEASSTAWVQGTVIGRDDSKLAAEVEGRLEEVLEVGDRVQAGDVVARIESLTFQLKVAEAEAELIPIQAKLDFYLRESRRLEKLARKNNTAKNRLDEVSSSYDEYAGQLKATKLRLALAKDQQERTLVKAPFNGVVSERYKAKGERVDSGDEVLRLIDTNSLEVRARITQEATGFVSANTSIFVSDSKHDEMTSVRALVPVGDDTSRLYELRLTFQNEYWLAGQAVRVAVPLSKKRNIVAVPRDALVIRQDGTTVFKVGKGNMAEMVSVKLGVAQGQFVEVIGDLSAGDTVVTRGNERLRPGQAVQIVNEPA